MKKYILLIVLFSIVLVGCNKKIVTEAEVNAITDVTTLATVITQVAKDINAGAITPDQAQLLVEQLQQKYVALSGANSQTIDDQFDRIQQLFDAQSIAVYTLPLWAKKLGMSYPMGMNLDTSVSKPLFLTTTGYYSSTLVYTGIYAIALEQAEIIAGKAYLSVSKNFAQAQALAKIGDIDYISGLDLGSLTQGIIYVNHELLDTNFDNLLSVSVNPEGVLTIEATKYTNN